MLDFKVKMHQIQFRLGLCPRSRWGSLQCSPDPLAGLKGPTSEVRGGERVTKGRERKERGREGRERDRVPKLLLNQGPSEPCYATGKLVLEDNTK